MIPHSVREVHGHVVAAETPLRTIHAELVASRAGRIELVSLLDDLRIRLREYLEIVEQELLPLLRDADAWGQARVERLLGDHDAVVRALRLVCREVEGCREVVPELSADVQALRRQLAVALDDGDVALAVVDAADEGPIVADQMSG